MKWTARTYTICLRKVPSLQPRSISKAARKLTNSRFQCQYLELYNLKEDIGELDNVAAEHTDIVCKLAAELSERLKNWNAGMPLVRGTGAPVEMPDELLR